jgi:PAS domain S-box-containing protein
LEKEFFHCCFLVCLCTCDYTSASTYCESEPSYFKKDYGWNRKNGQELHEGMNRGMIGGVINRRIWMGVILLCCAMPGSGYGAEFRPFTYSVEEGLPTNAIKDVCEDSDGFIWIATDEGVSKFDGETFTNYLRSLPSHYIKRLYRTRDDRLLIVSDFGVSVVENQRIPLLLEGSDVQKEGALFYPKDIYEDRDGDLWISEPNAVVRYDGTSLTRYFFDEAYRTDSYERGFSVLEMAPRLLVVVSQRGSIFLFNPKLDIFEELAVTVHSAIAEVTVDGVDGVDAVYRFPDGRWILGCSTGVYLVSVNMHTKTVMLDHWLSVPQISSFALSANQELLIGSWTNGLLLAAPPYRQSDMVPYASPHRHINRLYVSKEKSVWICGGDGLSILQPQVFTPLSSGFSNLYMTSIIAGTDGTVHATNGEAIYSMHTRGNEAVVDVVFERRDSFITSLAVGNDSLYIGYRDGYIDRVYEGEVRRIELPERGNRVVFYMTVDSRGDLWIMQDALMGVYRLSPDQSLRFFSEEDGLTTHVNHGVEADNGRMVFVGNGAGDYLFEYDPATERFCNRSVPLPLPEDVFFAADGVAATPGNSVWITSTQGIYHLVEGVLQPTYQDQNEEIGRVTAIGYDEDDVWFGTNRKLIRHHKDQFIYYGIHEGLPSSTIANRGIAIDEEGHVWVATSNGIAYWHASEREASQTAKPVFTSLQINGDDFSFTAAELIPYPYHSYLECHFLSLMYPMFNILYEVGIHHAGEEHRYLQTDGALVLHELKPGWHTLSIRAKKNGYAWSEQQQFSFAVKKPFYRTGVALVLYLFILMIIGLVTRNVIQGSREKRMARAELRESEERFRSLVETAGSVILCLDSEHKVFALNQEAERVFHVTKVEAVGRSGLHLFRNPENGLIFKSKLDDVLQNRPVREFVHPVQQSEDDIIYLLWNITPMWDAANHFVGIIAIGQDITDFLKMEDDLKRAKEAAERANQTKNEFLAKMSHELRTPLNSVIGFSQILKRNKNLSFSKKDLMYVDRINNNGIHLLTLINEVLDIAKLEAGQMRLYLQEVDLSALIKDVAELIERQAQEKDLVLTVSVPVGVKSIQVDLAKMKQILINLIGNAIKFTDEGGVEVRLDADFHGNPLRIAVKDTGIGIRQEDLSTIFDAFHQLDAGLKRKYQGTGLGLHICKSLCRLMGYQIVVDSEFGAGTTFTIDLQSE